MPDAIGLLSLGFVVLAAIALLGALGVGVGVVIAMRGQVDGDRE